MYDTQADSYERHIVQQMLAKIAPTVDTAGA